MRLDRIYSYYFMSARDMLDELRKIKELYRDGEMSYKRAYKRMDELVRMIQQRCELCFNLTQTPRQQTTAYTVLRHTHDIVAWMAA